MISLVERLLASQLLLSCYESVSSSIGGIAVGNSAAKLFILPFNESAVFVKVHLYYTESCVVVFCCDMVK